MIDVLTNPEANEYVYAVQEEISQGDYLAVAALDLRTRCPECGEQIPAGDPDHRMIGPYVIIGCEGYYLVDPNRVGISSPGWEAAR